MFCQDKKNLQKQYDVPDRDPLGGGADPLGGGAEPLGCGIEATSATFKATNKASFTETMTAQSVN